MGVHRQIGLKYDRCDPNIEVKGIEIGSAGNNINAANIKYSTLGFGSLYYISENVKLVLWYDKITNENKDLENLLMM